MMHEIAKLGGQGNKTFPDTIFINTLLLMRRKLVSGIFFSELTGYLEEGSHRIFHTTGIMACSRSYDNCPII